MGDVLAQASLATKKSLGMPEGLARSGCRVTSVRLTRAQPVVVPGSGRGGCGGLFPPFNPLVWGNPGAHESCPPDLGVRALSCTHDRGFRQSMDNLPARLPISVVEAAAPKGQPFLSPTARRYEKDEGLLYLASRLLREVI